jgi:putative ABC transport system permease protein
LRKSTTFSLSITLTLFEPKFTEKPARQTNCFWVRPNITKCMNNLVFSNMLHRPARTVVSISGIALGVMLIIFTIGLTNGSLRERADREANVGAEIFFRAGGTIGLSGSESFRLPVSTAKELEKIDGVKSAVMVGQTNVPAPESNIGSRFVEGIQFDEYASVTSLQIVEGTALPASGDVTVIDTAWQKQKKLKLGDTVITFERPFKIVGIYDPAVGARMKIPLSTMQTQLGSEGLCSAIIIKIKDGFNVDEVGKNISSKFPENQIISTKELPEMFLNSIPALGVFLNVVIGIASVISALVILLTMYTTVTERTRQIGIMKALGMSNGNIAWIIAQEALLISFCGVLFGIILTVLLKYILMNTTNLQVQLDPKVMLITLAVGLIGGALGALYPALRAARLDAVEALSYE